MEKKGWRTIAIVFIILFIAVVILFFWTIKGAVDILMEEDFCMQRCEINEECFYYEYDSYIEKCYQYDENYGLIEEINLS